MRLTGRVALVTECGHGEDFGVVWARALAREGAAVVVADRDTARAEGVRMPSTHATVLPLVQLRIGCDTLVEQLLHLPLGCLQLSHHVGVLQDDARLHIRQHLIRLGKDGRGAIRSGRNVDGRQRLLPVGVFAQHLRDRTIGRDRPRVEVLLGQTQAFVQPVLQALTLL